MDSKISRYLLQEEVTLPSQDVLKQLVSLIDLTTLNALDSRQTIVQLCEKATTYLGDVAAICVYPKFIPIVAENVGSKGIKIASVANFPSGSEDLKEVQKEIATAIRGGANEIDIVFPYEQYLRGETNQSLDYIAQCKEVCNDVTTKIILEISEYPKLDQIYTLCRELISLEIDFLKTSTGKSKHGATLEGATVILLAIKEAGSNTGFKASGGIKTIGQACAYLSLAKRIMGDKWVDSSHLRIGASTLLEEILAKGNIT